MVEPLRKSIEVLPNWPEVTKASGNLQQILLSFREITAIADRILLFLSLA
jgi:hypothetical protein